VHEQVSRHLAVLVNPELEVEDGARPGSLREPSDAARIPLSVIFEHPRHPTFETHPGQRVSAKAAHLLAIATRVRTELMTGRNTKPFSMIVDRTAL
jgi:hypothetical protein